MQNKLVWPAVAIVCALIIGGGLYFGLRDDTARNNQQTSLGGRNQGGTGGTGPVIDNGQDDASKTGQITVYVTRTGKCYHRAGCRYLRKSRIPISLKEAKKRYRPCSVCNPPQ